MLDFWTSVTVFISSPTTMALPLTDNRIHIGEVLLCFRGRGHGDLQKKYLHMMEHSLIYPLILSSFFLDEQNSWFVNTMMVSKHGITHSPVKLTEHLDFIKQKHHYPFLFNHFPGIDIIFY